MTTEQTARWYGVSSGNGNDGVSHMFPDYFVKTDNPWRLAKLAALSTFKPGAGMAWCYEHLEVDGEPEFTITAVLYDPPSEDTADGEYPDVDDPEAAEDGRNWSEANGAWQLFDIFPADTGEDGALDNPRDRPSYESLDECFSAPELKMTTEDR